MRQKLFQLFKALIRCPKARFYRYNISISLLFISIFQFWQIIQILRKLMNSIIKNINLDKESQQILGYDNLLKFVENCNGHACVFFVADWSVPSRLAYKRIKKLCFNRKKIGFVDVDLVDNIELCDKFKITKVPHCLVFDHEKIQIQFVGLDIEKLNEALIKFNAKEEQLKKIPPKKCPNGHQYETKMQLPYPPYIDNYFYCNRCKKIEKCSQNTPIQHCGECDYDLCKHCQLVIGE